MKWQFSGRKTVLLLVTLFLGRLLAVGQQNHFMYIQSDSKEPFYVLLNKKNFSSSSSGYLIISQIASGQYTFTVGFPQNKYPEQRFTCTIDNKDVGYGLKNLGDKGWALVNLQSMEMILAGSGNARQSSTTAAQPQTAAGNSSAAPATGTGTPATGKKDSGLFGDMLSQVVDDPSIKNVNTAAPAVKNNTPKKTAAAQQPAATPVQQVQQEQAKAPTSVTEAAEDDRPESNTRGVIKTREEARKEGRNVTFIDFNANGGDTVKIFIPKPGSADYTGNSNSGAVAEAVPDKKRKTLFDGDATVNGEESKTVNNPFYAKSKDSNTAPAATPVVNNSNTAADASVAAAAQTTAVPATEEKRRSSGIASYNSNCAGMANDNDLARLRKRMVGAGDDDKMIEVARKAFKSKCYTTEQIKNLGMLFYTDENRYKFYDAGYPFVYDVTNYPSLESMLIDDYYKKRFRAMLRL